MAESSARVGIVGCGAISATYIQNAKRFAAFEVVAVADLRLDAARARAEEFGVPKACSVDELLDDPDLDIVVNLTSHKAHGPVGIAALEAGKHVYIEKPLAVHREQGLRMLHLAEEKGLRVGAAPDTFFGGAWQTARKLIDEGAIGEPIGAFICLQARAGGPRLSGPEKERPEGYVSFYQTDFFEFGVTWIFDRGPYYLHAVINLLGPVERVTASAKKTWDERERGGRLVPARTPTHIAGLLDFANGAVGTLLITSDVYATGLPHVEIYGSEASLRCIDPNNFGGTIFLRKPESADLIPVDCPFGYNMNGRGVGIADMAVAIRNGRPHRANGAMGYHVIDIVHGFHEASSLNRHVFLTSRCDRPAPLPLGLEDWTIDE
jgi:predicted dehydrogenase